MIYVYREGDSVAFVQSPDFGKWYESCANLDDLKKRIVGKTGRVPTIIEFKKNEKFLKIILDELMIKDIEEYTHFNITLFDDENNIIKRYNTEDVVLEDNIISIDLTDEVFKDFYAEINTYKYISLNEKAVITIE